MEILRLRAASGAGSPSSSVAPAIGATPTVACRVGKQAAPAFFGPPDAVISRAPKGASITTITSGPTAPAVAPA